ncbi:DUF6519 domain-containing protein [Nocardia sp. bgisy134]|uniref:DUF6519 domain-containing protein n=1 Tax=Nocardia sp. bgisy134 TaxID=3413789 RepID=UPI003D759FB3
MAADVSRVRMDALRDHSGVGLQQGRVLPDSDLNELGDILDRRLRAQVADQRANNVAQVSKLTPGAFEITAEDGSLKIGRGRMYVDGLLAENHGDPHHAVFDGVLAEPTFDGSVDYPAQPYLPVPDPLPGGDGTHLAYLDVWQRELTYLNAPHLVESAIGVDTTTRTQTVWQVRLLADVGEAATCNGPIENWEELVAPSGARLTTGTVPVDPVDDPVCELPPTGGYRGLENHLYRVELHGIGAEGEPQFKWSRDNASIASPVVELISESSLRLSQLGHDDFIRFADNDWVEILDDNRELSRRTGELRQISVDQASGTISFDTPLPADLGPSENENATGRHLRIVLWNGVRELPDPHTAVELEHGITVEFGDDAGRPGDYWVFAARTADQSVEQLTVAPPRGIHHHYARLALISPGAVRDCRPSDPTPSAGCPCEICVTPTEHNSDTFTIQQAIERATNGATITLCPGEYLLREPLLLERVRSIVLRGPGAILTAGGTAIEVKEALDITVTGMLIVVSGTDPAVVLQDCGKTTLDNVFIDCRQSARQVGIALAGGQWITTLRRNLIFADTGIEGVTEPPRAETNGLRIEDNTIECQPPGVARDDDIVRCGITLSAPGGHRGELRITNNVVTGTDAAGIAATGLLVHGPTEPVDGVLTITGNVIETVAGVGIRTAARAVITDNEITSNQGVPDQHGIHIELAHEQEVSGHVQIVGNRAIGVGGFGILVDAPVASLLVKRNVVQNAGGGIVVRHSGRQEHICIDNNQILDLSNHHTAAFDGGADFVLGIAVLDSATGAGVVNVIGNVINGVPAQAPLASGTSAAFGVWVVLADVVRVSGNTILHVGGLALPAFGIFIGSTATEVAIADNMVRPRAEEDGRREAFWKALGVGGTAEGEPATPATVRVEGNSFYGGGVEAAAIISTVGSDAIVSTNRFVQPRPPTANDAKRALELQARRAVVQGNMAVGGAQLPVFDEPAMLFTMNDDALVAVGNMTTPGGIRIRNNPTDPPPYRGLDEVWSAVNRVV